MYPPATHLTRTDPSSPDHLFSRKKPLTYAHSFCLRVPAVEKHPKLVIFFSLTSRRTCPLPSLPVPIDHHPITFFWEKKNLNFSPPGLIYRLLPGSRSDPSDLVAAAARGHTRGTAARHSQPCADVDLLRCHLHKVRNLEPTSRIHKDECCISMDIPVTTMPHPFPFPNSNSICWG
jgi:hypothetical protein